jgi:hypothetical protein
MQQTELDRLRSILQLYVNNGLQILCNKETSVIQIDIKNYLFSWNMKFLISSHVT